MNHQDEEQVNDLSQNTRRAFCTELLASAGLLLAAPNLTQVIAAQDSMVAYPPRKIENAETLLPGASLYFNYPSRNDPAVLMRTRDGDYRAYSRRCSHAGCSVDVDATGRCLTCPCHQGTYDAQMGYVMFGPPRRPLDTIILQMRAGGQIWAVGKYFGRNREMIAKDLGGGD
jgi:Rieske Fe-S protein